MKFFFYLILGVCLAGCAENVELKKSSFEPKLKEFRKFRNKKMAGNGSPIPSEDKNNFDIDLNLKKSNEIIKLVKKKFNITSLNDIINM